MKIRQIQQSGGVALRIGLLPYRGRFSVFLLISGLGTLALFPWRLAVDPESASPRSLAFAALAAFYVIFSLASYFAHHLIQIEPERHIRKGWTILGVKIWLGKVAISRIAGLQPDLSDPDNPLLKCVDPSGASILAIEGLRDTREVEQFAGYLWRQLGDQDTAVHEFVESVGNSPSREPRRSLRWMLVGTAFLFGLIISMGDSGGDLGHRLVSTFIAVTIAALGLVAAIPDEKITRSDADEAIIRGWVRRRFFWIEDYTWELKDGSVPVITRSRFDRCLLVQGLVLVSYGVIVFCLVSRPADRSSGAKADNKTPAEQSEEEFEKMRKGAERLKEFLEKRRQENE